MQMIDFDIARQKMVDNQIRTEDVTDHALLDAMQTVPRELFVPQELSSLCYTDKTLPLSGFGAENRFMASPAKLAKMLQAANLTGKEIVLIVGAGSGYSAAVCSELALSIVAVEEHDQLAETASATLADNGYDNVAVVRGPLKNGLENEAPYDVILFDGSVPQVPATILNQLADNGRLIAVTGFGNSGRLVMYTQQDGLICETELMNCALDPLPGFELEAEFVF